MKILFWELNAKGKFTRTVWFGTLCLAIIYAGTIYAEFSWTLTIIATIVYVMNVGYLYRKMKQDKQNKS